MIIVYDIYFDQNPPGPEEILPRLEQHTGLAGFALNEDKDAFSHPQLKHINYFFFTDDDHHTVKVETFSPTPGYLIVALAATLINMGGKYPDGVPSWANKKWEEVKHFFDMPQAEEFYLTDWQE